MCLQSIHYIYAMKGEITGMIACVMVIFNPGRSGRDLVRSRTLLQLRLALFSLLPKHVAIGK